MTSCNRCNKPIRWKLTYEEYLKRKKEDPDLKNIPLNLDGSPHECSEEIYKQASDIKEYVPEKDDTKRHIIREACLHAATRLYAGSTLPADDIIQIARRFEIYVDEG